MNTFDKNAGAICPQHKCPLMGPICPVHYVEERYFNTTIMDYVPETCGEDLSIRLVFSNTRSLLVSRPQRRKIEDERPYYRYVDVSDNNLFAVLNGARLVEVRYMNFERPCLMIRLESAAVQQLYALVELQEIHDQLVIESEPDLDD